MTPTKPESPTRRSRLVRRDAAEKILPFSQVEHGPAILALLDTHVWLTNDLVELAVFRHDTTRSGQPRSPGGSAYAANTALRRLFDLGLVDRVPAFLPGRAPGTTKQHYVNVLSGAGARLAARLKAERGEQRRWKRSLLPRPWQPLLHAFWVRQFALTAEAACGAAGVRFWSWFDDRKLAELKAKQGASYATVPDGFFLITDPATGKHYPHFVEIDLGSQTVAARQAGRRDWRGKVESYVSYISRGFREQFGVEASPVVLTLTDSPARLEHLTQATAAVGGGGRFWFCTIEQLLPADSHAREAAFWAPIWRVPTSNQLRRLDARWRP